ncbi:MAG: hypothetical protein Q9209_003904 [Squamulea sp. 1 TL-2023]
MDDPKPPMYRRSHPSLHHLSLNALTHSSVLPTPSSPTLAPTTPSSYISPAALPSTYQSILSRSPSRTKIRSAGPIPVMDTNQNYKSRPGSRHHSRRGTSTTTPTGGSYDVDSSWLTRTASTLAMHAMEEKGQAWLASRSSATSLSHTDIDTYNDASSTSFEPTFPPRMDTKSTQSRSSPPSHYSSRVPSRVGSKSGSRAGSGSDLRMTQTKLSSPTQNDGPLDALPDIAQDLGDIEPDFINLDERDREEQEAVEVVDEGEMRRLILGRFGGWVDWMVGWMDFRELRGDDEVCEVKGNEADDMENTRGEAQEKRGHLRERDGGDMEKENEGGIPAPDSGNGAWEDAKWLLKIAANSL